MGASDAPIALGLSNYRTPSELASEKRMARLGIGGMPDPVTDDQKRGHLLEAVVVEMYGLLYPTYHILPAIHCVHPSYPWMAATPDRFLGDARGEAPLLECKTHSRWLIDKYGDIGTENIPDYEFCQVQHQMAVTGAPWVDLAILFGEQETLAVLARMVEGGTEISYAANLAANLDFSVYRIKRDDGFIEALIAAEEEFWNRYVLGDETPVDIRTMKPRHGIKLATDEDESLAVALKRAWLASKRREAEYKEARASVEKAIGEYSGLETKCGNFSWAKNKDTMGTVTDWQAVALDLLQIVPDSENVWLDLLKKHTEEKVVKFGPRVFRVPLAWKKEM